MDTKKGTLPLSSKRKDELLSLLNISSTCRRMTVKSLERLIGKIRSMHFAIPGAIYYFYSMHVVLTSARSAYRTTTYLLARFHQYMHFWRELCEFMDIRPICLAEIVHRDSSDLRCRDASGDMAGGVWVDPNEDRVNKGWKVQWPEYITAKLVSFDNLKIAITKSDLKLASLVLQ